MSRGAGRADNNEPGEVTGHLEKVEEIPRAPRREEEPEVNNRSYRIVYGLTWKDPTPEFGLDSQEDEEALQKCQEQFANLSETVQVGLHFDQANFVFPGYSRRSSLH